MYGVSSAVNLAKISSHDLHRNVVSLAKREREITLEVLHHLREIERRSLYAERGYPSLFEYAVHELKYSQGAAHRRISSMRLLKEIPEIQEKVQNGEISLSTLSKAQSFFRQEKDLLNCRKEKIEILKVLENKSAREVDRELVSRSSNPQKLMPERIRPVSETHTELKVLVEGDVLKDLEELKNLLSHARPHASLKELLSFAVRETVLRLRPKAPKQSQQPKQPKQPAEPPKLVPTVETSVTSGKAGGLESQKSKEESRHISAQVKKAVWQRDLGKCTYVDPVSGRHCGSSHALEYDHIQPLALGGKSSEENLRLRCRAHNQLAAISVFGQQKMQYFVPRMRMG